MAFKAKINTQMKQALNMVKEEETTTEMITFKIPKELKKNFKMKLLQEEITISECLIKYIKKYTEQNT
jgi:hypothetical protein